jgi:hypothetical protein
VSNETIIVEPALELRAEFARWGLYYQPAFRTVSPHEFEVPAGAFTEAPEELLIGAIVDGHPYRSPVEDELLGVAPPGTWPGPEQVQEYTPAEPASEPAPAEAGDDAAETWHCDSCGRDFATQRGLNKHRRSAHPEEN